MVRHWHADGAQQPKKQAAGGAGSDALQLIALEQFAIRAQVRSRSLDYVSGLQAQGLAVAQQGGETVIHLVDIGANLQSKYSRPAITRQLERAAAAGVGTVVLTGCDLEGSLSGVQTSEWWWAQQQAPEELEQCPQTTPAPPRPGRTRLYCTAGVHPHDAKSIARVECEGSAVCVDPAALAELRRLAAAPWCVSLGECGLDYDRMFSPRDVQLAVFEAQAALAAELGMPLFVHCRDRDADKGSPLGAYADLCGILKRYARAGESGGLRPERVCIHCFTGGAEELQVLWEQGFCVGVTGFLGIAKRCGATAAALAGFPLDRLMIETDAPFMGPDKCWLPAATGLGGRKNEPASMPAVCRALAVALGLEPEVVAAATSANADVFFGFGRAEAAVLAHAAPAVSGTTVTTAHK